MTKISTKIIHHTYSHFVKLRQHAMHSCTNSYTHTNSRISNILHSLGSFSCSTCYFHPFFAIHTFSTFYEKFHIDDILQRNDKKRIVFAPNNRFYFLFFNSFYLKMESVKKIPHQKRFILLAIIYYFMWCKGWKMFIFSIVFLVYRL